MPQPTITIWEQEAFFANADVIIVGAGFMGLWTAYELKKQHPVLKIIIVERSIASLGASIRNAGFACFGSPTELWKDYETMGENEMLQIVEKRYKGIEKIKQLFSQQQLHYENCGGYECLNKKDEPITDKLNFLNKLLQPITNNQQTFFITNQKLQEFGLCNFSTLIENKEEGYLHSGFFLKNLSKKVADLGITILYGMDVTSWQANDNFIEVTCNAYKIKTKKLVFCTNAFTKNLINNASVVPARGQIIVTSPIDNLALKGTFHFDEGFYYWRNVNNRILLGGARNKAFAEEETNSFETSTLIQQALEHFLQQHIVAKNNYTIDYRWSGIMAFTTDKKPIIQTVCNNVFAAVACNGMGVALTPIFAEEVAKKVLDVAI